VIKQELKLHLVETMDDVLKIALTRELPPKPPRRSPRSRPSWLPRRGGGWPGEPPLTH